MTTINRLSMVILMQQDIEAAVVFYEALGCTLRFKLPGQWAELGLGEITLGLCPADQPSEPRRTGLVFSVTDIQTFYTAHKNTLPFLSEPIIKVHGGMVSVQDPYGNIIDLYQATPEKVKELLKNEAGNDACCKKNEDTGEACCKA
jgi:predicted enzyme related to lactoylglutathione lyase